MFASSQMSSASLMNSDWLSASASCVCVVTGVIGSSSSPPQAAITPAERAPTSTATKAYQGRIGPIRLARGLVHHGASAAPVAAVRSEEHTSELQSLRHL